MPFSEQEGLAGISKLIFFVSPAAREIKCSCFPGMQMEFEAGLLNAAGDGMMSHTARHSHVAYKRSLSPKLFSFFQSSARSVVEAHLSPRCGLHLVDRKWSHCRPSHSSGAFMGIVRSIKGSFFDGCLSPPGARNFDS